MKKIFTLAAIAMVAMGANAQTETYSAISADGTLASEFANIIDENGNATNLADGKSIVTFGTTSISVEGVGGSTPADVPDVTGDKENTHVDISAEGVVGSWNPIKWNKENKQFNDVNLNGGYRIVGTGNPYISMGVEPIMTDGANATYIGDDGQEHNKYRATYVLYTPGSSLPISGLYYKFSTKAAGQLKVGIWANKGNRKVFVVEESDNKLVDRSFEGYINGQNNADNSKKYLSTDQIDSIHLASLAIKDTLGNVTGYNEENYVVGQGNQPFYGYTTFNVEANKTYWVFGDSWQIGFFGYEFTPGAADGISTVSNQKTADKNAPVFNLAGQRVSKAYKGVVIQNGRKFVQK